MIAPLICPACEAGDHEHAALCEADYKCACACHSISVYTSEAGTALLADRNPRRFTLPVKEREISEARHVSRGTVGRDNDTSGSEQVSIARRDNASLAARPIEN